MTDDPDIKRRALDLIDRHGDPAATHSTIRYAPSFVPGGEPPRGHRPASYLGRRTGQDRVLLIHAAIETDAASIAPRTAPSRRAAARLDAGDLDGAATWRRILEAIKQLQGEEPAGTVH